MAKKDSADQGLPTCRQIYDGNAGRLWNIICCPLNCTIGLLIRSILTFCMPCLKILCLRLTRGLHYYCKCILCCFKWPFEDDEFYGDAATGDGAPTTWRRAHELKTFHGKRPQLFEGKIEPSDLCQGAVGNCWLVSALACAAEHPDSIRNMFSTKEYNPRGLYKIFLYDPIKEKFIKVTVDDRIPCNSGTKIPRFMNPNGNELWAMLLEKAFAKFCGSYTALDGGFVLWAWHVMTGDNVFQMSRKPDKQWVREDMKPAEDKNNKRACKWRTTKEAYTSEDLWILLKKYDRQKALISASIAKSGNDRFSGPNGEEMLDAEGLVAGHAYSLLKAVEVTNTRKFGVDIPMADIKLALDTNVMNRAVGSGSERVRLVQLRNPWGTFEWKGDWSDKSKLWKKNPHIAKAVGYIDADDGAFWMSFEDFEKTYSRINVCDRTTVNDLSLDANEGRGSCGVACGCCFGCTQFWCCCKGFRSVYLGRHSKEETLEAKEKCCFIC